MIGEGWRCNRGSFPDDLEPGDFGCIDALVNNIARFSFDFNPGAVSFSDEILALSENRRKFVIEKWNAIPLKCKLAKIGLHHRAA